MHLAYSYALNEQGTQLCYSTVFHQSISTMFSSNNISQHNLNSNIPYRPYTTHTIHTMQTHAALLMHGSTVSAYVQDRPHLSCSVWQVHCTPHAHQDALPALTHHTAFHNPLHMTKKHAKHICVSSGKMAQDVGMV